MPKIETQYLVDLQAELKATRKKEDMFGMTPETVIKCFGLQKQMLTDTGVSEQKATIQTSDAMLEKMYKRQIKYGWSNIETPFIMFLNGEKLKVEKPDLSADEVYTASLRMEAERLTAITYASSLPDTNMQSTIYLLNGMANMREVSNNR